MGSRAAPIGKAHGNLPNESTEEFQFLLDSHVDQFHPRTQLEMELVEAMAAAPWRLRRIQLIETTLLTTEMVRRAEVIGRQFTDVDADARLTSAFQKFADNGNSLSLLLRYERALNRSYDHAFKHLLQSSTTKRTQDRPNPCRYRGLPSCHARPVVDQPEHRHCRAAGNRHHLCSARPFSDS